MNIFQTEKKTYDSWRKRLLFPTLGAYEMYATRHLKKKYHFKKIKEQTVIARLAQAHVAFLGDDQWVVEDQEKIRNLFFKLPKNKRPHIILTDRRNHFPLKLPILSRKISFSPKIEMADRKLLSEVQKYLKQKKRVWVWSGTLRLPHFKKNWKNHSACWVHLEPRFCRWNARVATGWRQFDVNEFAFVERSPLLSLEAYRIWNEKNKNRLHMNDQKIFFEQARNVIRARLRLPKVSSPKYVFSVFEMDELQTLFTSSRWKRHRRFIVDRILKGESAVFPATQMVLLSSLEHGHVAEEAAHQLRLSMDKSQMWGDVRTIVEEAFAFFGSLLLAPERKIPIPEISENHAWQALHITGYRLGKKLFWKWNLSKKTQASICDLWKTSLRTEWDAIMVYEQMRLL